MQGFACPAAQYILGNTECISMKQSNGFNSVALHATSIEALICATDNSVL